MSEQFSERDLDRPWSQREIAALSEAELTKLAFFRDAKNWGFFLPVAVVLWFSAWKGGAIGRGLGWIGVVTFGVFVLNNGATVGLSGLSLVGALLFERQRGRIRWIFLQLLLSIGNLMMYGGLGYMVYVGIRASHTY